MKRLLFIPVLLLSSLLFSQDYQLKQPVCQQIVYPGFTVYITTGQQNTSKFDIAATSISFTSTGGLYAGTTSFLLASYSINSFVSMLNSISSTTVGLEGKIVASLTTGYFDGSETLTKLPLTAATSIKGIANIQALRVTETKKLFYVIPPVFGIRNCLDHASVNVTYPSGNTYVKIYDGSTSTNTVIHQSQVTTSGVQYIVPLSYTSKFASNYYNQPMLFEVTNSSCFSSGWININYFQKGY